MKKGPYLTQFSSKCKNKPTLFSPTFKVGEEKVVLFFHFELVELRKLQPGCHIGGCWLGAACYADDLILLAPSRDVLQKMLQVCESYATNHNLVFSTDPLSAKSKSKYIYYCGRLEKRVTYPAPLSLDGKSIALYMAQCSRI